MADVAPLLNPKGLETGFPQLWHDINNPLLIVYGWGQVLSLGSARKPVPLSADQLRALADALEQPSIPPVLLTPASATVPAAGGSFTFHVATRYAGQWTAESDPADAWLTIDSPTGPQVTDGDVSCTAAANIGAARTANIQVNDQVFAVTQEAGA